MDFLINIAAAAAVVWVGWFVLRGSLVGGCVAVIIVGSCFGYLFWHAEGGIPITVDRAMIGLLAITYLVRRRLGLADPKPLGRAEWVLLALLAVLAFSTFTHNWNDGNIQPAAHWVCYWLLPGLVYWIARQSPLDRRTLRGTWIALAIFGVYLTYTALAETTGQWWAVFPSYIASPKTEYFGRARGPFLHPAEMGIFLTLCLAAALTFWSKCNRGGQLLLLALTSLTMVAIYATLTRCVWMGSTLGFAILIGFSVPRQWRFMLLGGGMIVGIGLLATSWDSVWNLKRDVHLDASASVDSAELRPLLADVAWKMFLDRPLLGCGMGQYDREKMPYLADRSSDLPLEKTIPYVQHNAFLALLVETGLVGMGLYILLLALWIRNAWRLWIDNNAPPFAKQTGMLFLMLVGAYLPNASFQDTNIIDGVNLLLFFVAGIVSGLAAQGVRSLERKTESREHQELQTPELVLQSI